MYLPHIVSLKILKYTVLRTGSDKQETYSDRRIMKTFYLTLINRPVSGQRRMISTYHTLVTLGYTPWSISFSFYSVSITVYIIVYVK